MSRFATEDRAARRPRVSAPQLFVMVAVAGVVLPSPAPASCRPPEPRIVWSYPADGATDVPTNGHIFVLTSTWNRPSQVTVNGQTVPVGPLPFEYVPALAPHTTYVVDLPPVAAAPSVQLRLQFTTGPGPAAVPTVPAPTVNRVSLLEQRAFSSMCTDVWRAMDCFDTGQSRHMVFETETRPLFWLVERVPSVGGETPGATLWPADCGDPSLYVHPQVSCNRPYRLRAVAFDGTSQVADVPCTPADAAQPAGMSESGCAVAGARADGAGGSRILVVFALLASARTLRFRRRSAAQRSSAMQRPGPGLTSSE